MRARGGTRRDASPPVISVPSPARRPMAPDSIEREPLEFWPATRIRLASLLLSRRSRSNPVNFPRSPVLSLFFSLACSLARSLSRSSSFAVSRVASLSLETPVIEPSNLPPRRDSSRRYFRRTAAGRGKNDETTKPSPVPTCREQPGW